MKRFLTILLLFLVFVLIVIVPLYIWGSARFTSFSDQEKTATGILVTTFELVGIVVSIVIVLIILYQYFRYRHPYRLVFEAFSNESALFDTAKKPLNLSILAQEELERRFKILYNEFMRYSGAQERSQDFEALAADELYIERDEVLENGLGGFIPVEQIKKSGLIDDLKEVIKFLKDPKGMNLISLVGEIAPKEVVPVMKLIEAIIPPHVIKATGYLQWRSDNADKVGMTFKYEDLSNQRNLMVRTLWWRPLDEPAPSTRTRAPVAPAAGDDVVANIVAEQYIQLLEPAMYWMALMFWEQKLLSHVPLHNHILRYREKRRQARVLYLLGALYYAQADQFREYREFFCQLAVEHFRQASVKDSSWPLPGLYLANLYYFKARASKEEKVRQQLLQVAWGLYGDALKRAEKVESIHTRQRILVARAWAELDSGDPVLADKASKDVVELEKIGPANYDPQRPDCGIFLYNLALCYMKAGDTDAYFDHAEKQARRILACCLVRAWKLKDMISRNFQSLETSPDTDGIARANGVALVDGMSRADGVARTDGMARYVKFLEQVLSKDQEKFTQLNKLIGKDFEAAILLILKEVEKVLGEGQVDYNLG